MGNPLYDRRPLRVFAESAQFIEIAEKISSFERLARIIEADLATLEADRLPAGWRNSVVAGELSFGFLDAQRAVPALRGFAEVEIDAVCQRCLEPFMLPVSTQLRLLFTDQPGAEGVDDGFEVWELEEELLRPLDVVEESLIMALPYAPKHAAGEGCAAVSKPERGAEVEVSRPFAALREQMDGDKSR
jgi:uncharacterized protein